MAKTSAGLLLYRIRDRGLEVLLVHLGGPFWQRKDDGAWFIPKGELEPGEDELAAAKREFAEETGIAVAGELVPLGTVKNRGGKAIHVWAFAGDCDPGAIRSNTFRLEWPPRSGRQQEFPEIDRAAFFTLEQARAKLHPAEWPFVERLAAHLHHRGAPKFVQ